MIKNKLQRVGGCLVVAILSLIGLMLYPSIVFSETFLGQERHMLKPLTIDGNNIVGYYMDDEFHTHGFSYTIPESEKAIDANQYAIINNQPPPPSAAHQNCALQNPLQHGAARTRVVSQMKAFEVVFKSIFCEGLR